MDDTRRAALAGELRRRIHGEVRFDDGSRALYSTDGSNYRALPEGVVLPRHAGDVFTTVAVCRAHGVPIVGRGGGTSLAGQTCNTAVVIDFSKYMNRVVSLDARGRTAVVEPGVILDDLRMQAEVSRLTFGPDPSTHSRCTLGGMIGNNSCGVHSMMAGCTAANVESLEVLTYRGARLTAGELTPDRLARIDAQGGPVARLLHQVVAFRDRHADAIRAGFPRIARRVSGYNLPALLPENGFHLGRALVGSESTLVTVLSATVRLVPSPPHRVLVALGYPSVFEAADHLEEVLEARPIGLEGLDDVLVDGMKKKDLHPESLDVLPGGKGWLLVELGADSTDEAEEQARALRRRLERSRHPPSVKVLADPKEAATIWRVRESGLGATARVPGEADTWEGWEDASVPVAAMGAYLRDFRAQLDRYGYRAALYGHFGQGCVHTRIPFELRSQDGVARFRRFVEEAADLCVRHGGSLSGEHGDGQARAELLPRMFSPELMRAMEEWKGIWDPDNGMNPGKVVNARKLDEDLRVGPGYIPPPVKTAFAYPDDAGSFPRAVERCVGVGECRRLDGGVMCPSFMVTREEMHSTRGRARLLFEVLRGGVPEGFHSEAVKESLDLCLSCKGCKSDCPVSVDMATYKAEFFSHHYRGKLRPAAAYLFGLVYYWARLGSVWPGLVNWTMRQPALARLMKRVGGLAPERDLPLLAPRTFRSTWRASGDGEDRRPEVVLWADTFNDHWQPDVLRAAAEVLEGTGHRVVVPDASVCCGRPLYEHGMLDTARRTLRRALARLRPSIRAGVPVVGVEPSCVAVLRDELPALFPDDADARALSRSAVMLDEFLARQGSGWSPVPTSGQAIVHPHCHQHALMDHDAHAAVLERVGLDARFLDAGCCGMAGGFGYEASHYEVSIACGERVLLPTVRQTPDDVLIIADGYSCREQIAQRTGRTALHTAQVLAMAGSRGAPSRGEPTHQLPSGAEKEKV